MAGKRPYDPRVKMRNFGMQYAAPQTDAPDIQSQAAQPLDDGGPSDTGFSNVQPAPESQLSPPQYGQRGHHGDPVEIKNPREGKPFGFALAHGTDGASIWWGELLTTITIIRVKKDADDNIVIAGQPAIPTTTKTEAENLETDKLLQTHLGWYGNVYGEWDANDSGEVTRFEITGPDEPEGVDISELKPDLTRDTPAGTYYVLIGTVEDAAPVDQHISGDIPWFVTILKGEDSGSSSSSVSSAPSSSSRSSGSGSGPSSGGSGGSGSGSGSGSSKSTCIVPCGFHAEEFAALFLPEMPREGVFLDTMEIDLNSRRTVDLVDPRFVEVCEPGTFSIIGFSCESPIALGFRVDGSRITVTRPWWSRRCKAIVMIHAIRKGFLHQLSQSPYHLRRLPQRNRNQFEQNEAFINSAYDAY